MRIPKIYRGMFIFINVTNMILSVLMWRFIALETRSLKDFLMCAGLTIALFAVTNYQQFDVIKSSRKTRNNKFKIIREIRNSNTVFNYKDIEKFIDTLTLSSMKRMIK